MVDYAGVTRCVYKVGVYNLIKRIKKRIRSYEESNLILYCLIFRLWERPYYLGVDFLICYLYSLFISYKLFGVSFVPKVFFKSTVFRVVIKKSKDCIITSKTKIPFVFESFNYGVERTVFVFSKNSKVNIDNSFYIGNGCIINVGENSKLSLSGSKCNRLSGITSDSKIICCDDIKIGEGTIISWGCYITDSNNHKINGKLVNKPVSIGGNVWISEGCTIAPGAVIKEGTIVGAKSYVNGDFPSNVLLVGCPAVIKKANISWQR
ncbi:acyltransferase [Shewanella sp. ULN5]|uniref:acyltransferase n=1 Tax=Shewanella sp. ULN5 TaxID=2994678 RepID=UPI00273FB1BA|nr:acyltransferase [Shewanella sp. ULN5]MDP5145076.1 acyltransferase [Shewanella sp. ULN5]